jgi:hypothetical protein
MFSSDSVPETLKWDGHQSKFMVTKEAIENAAITEGVMEYLDAPQSAPIPTHGRRRTLEDFLYKSNPNYGETVPDGYEPHPERIPRINGEGNPTTLSQANKAYDRWVRNEAWDRRDAQYKADVEKHEMKERTALKILHSHLTGSAFQSVRDLFIARKPAAIWAELNRLGNVAPGPALTLAITDYNEFRWTNGNVMEMISELKRLENNMRRHLPASNAPVKTEAERIVHLVKVVNTAHAPIFGAVMDTLSQGKEDGTAYPIERYHTALFAKERSLANFTVWQYKKLHPEDYNKARMALHGIKKAAFAGAATAGDFNGLYDCDEDGGDNADELVLRYSAFAAGAPTTQFIFCPICGGNHTADACMSPYLRVCPDCGWRYNKHASPSQCPSKFHAQKGGRGRNGGGAGGRGGGKDGGGGRGGGKKQGAAVANAAQPAAADFATLVSSITSLTAAVASIKTSVDKNTEDINALAL